MFPETETKKNLNEETQHCSIIQCAKCVISKLSTGLKVNSKKMQHTNYYRKCSAMLVEVNYQRNKFEEI